MTVSADGTVGIIVVAAVLPEPAPAGYCAVRCLVKTDTDTPPSGTFALVGKSSPDVVEDGGITLPLVHGAKSVALVSGGAGTDFASATINVRQEAVVSFQLRTDADKPREYTNVTNPVETNADVEDLE